MNQKTTPKVVNLGNSDYSEQVLFEESREKLIKYRWWIQKPFNYNSNEKEDFVYHFYMVRYTTDVYEPDFTYGCKIEYLSEKGEWVDSDKMENRHSIEPTMVIPVPVLYHINDGIKGEIDLKEAEDLIFKMFLKWQKLIEQGERDDVLKALKGEHESSSG